MLSFSTLAVRKVRSFLNSSLPKRKEVVTLSPFLMVLTWSLLIAFFAASPRRRWKNQKVLVNHKDVKFFTLFLVPFTNSGQLPLKSCTSGMMFTMLAGGDVQSGLTNWGLLKSFVIERSSSCLILSKWHMIGKDPALQWLHTGYIHAG